MPEAPWRREISRHFHRQFRRRHRTGIAVSGGGRSSERGVPPAVSVLVTVLVALAVLGTAIRCFELKIRPVVCEIARTQIQNQFHGVLVRAVTEELTASQTSYADLVSIQRGEAGNILALSSDVIRMNQLRGQISEKILAALEAIDVSVIQIPLGSLFDSELLWARGPALCARAMSVGTVSAEFDSQFSAAGVNQTVHRICLDVQVPITVILPGASVETTVFTQVCIAETVIVGQVPDTYLQFDGGLPN